ncbi:hypothetical protein [Phormidium sp. CCY1219]|uniref:hypothetical protein n=1 Tax=Phormidium sp. CCY1219 TaxID=2886104 RepID=UPI002D1F3F1C|nr:hypothetical protein [Phormidium sp. CCY1219]MEB3828427.1 hypothetical protein [Phormidium sp. CCY1219]
MNEEELRRKLDREIDIISINQLNDLGNRAVELGLIVGHGYRGGQYEILRQGEALMMTPPEAQSYLENLLRECGE